MTEKKAKKKLTTSAKDTKQPKTPLTQTKKNASLAASSMSELLATHNINTPRKGQEQEATIVSVSKRQLIFDIGWKSYAVLGQIESQELSTYLPFLKPGVTVKVKVVVEESRDGYPVVSMRKFFEKGKWDILEEAQKKESEIEVVCGEYGKGGVFVEFMGIRGVVPKIQLSKEYINNPEALQGQRIKVKVLEVDSIKNRLVASQKAAALGLSYKDIKRDFDMIKVNSKQKATVVGFTEFGVFCEVGQIEGLIHISEISWEKVTDPKKYLKEGSVVDVVVVEKNEENLKLNLSIKRMSFDPWDEIEKRYPQDKEVKGEVIRKEKYGYIVRLEPGVEGLVHISKLPESSEIKVGDSITIYVERVDPSSRRMSLVLLPTEKPVAYR